MFEFFIARRYLRAKRKQVMISVITLISIVGVAAGVMALVIALAVTTGLRETTQKNLLGLTAHVSIQEKTPGDGIASWETLVAHVAKLPHVASAAPGLYEPAFITGPVNSSGLTVKGVLLDPATLPDPLRRLKSGSIDALRPNANSGELPGIVLGSKLADSIGARAGKQVELVNPYGEVTPLGPRPSFQHFLVAGTFETGFFEADNAWAFMSLKTAQRAYHLDQDDVVNSIELRLDDVYQAPAVEREVSKLLPPTLAATTWEEQNAPILEALEKERIVTIIVIGLIVLVAALNILIALVMMVMEKHRDIAVLMSMGARASQIRNIFVCEGALIGVIGTAAGLIVGYALCFFAGHYRWIALNEQVYSMPYVPFISRPFDGVVIGVSAIVISLLATLYPARSATRIAPVEALRYE
ncbi:MAG TPA: ABC transporter permease [Bryobacteraceae bacterium]|nr:ABC transporter permease [Bryobacteraceae bacterium]